MARGSFCQETIEPRQQRPLSTATVAQNHRGNRISTRKSHQNRLIHLGGQELLNTHFLYKDISGKLGDVIRSNIKLKTTPFQVIISILVVDLLSNSSLRFQSH